MGKLWLFGLFPGHKGDNIDMWMIKITIKSNQIDIDVLLISKVDNVKKPCLSLKFYQNLLGLIRPLRASAFKATSRLTIFMRGLLAKSKIQRNNYHHGNGGPSLTSKTSSVSLIFTHGTHRNVNDI